MALRWLPKSLYSIQLSRLDPHLRGKFKTLSPGNGTKNFVERRRFWGRSKLAGCLYRILTTCRLLTNTDAAALLGTHEMFVLDADAAKTLLSLGSIQTYLDIGAGSGSTTAEISSLLSSTTIFNRGVVATDISKICSLRLRMRGFEVLDYELEKICPSKTKSFDLVSCLNVLDRCPRPKTLLQQAAHLVKPSGRLLVALVYPSNPFVEVAPGKTKIPEENLLSEKSPSDETFEGFVNRFCRDFLSDELFSIQSIGRVPYLCENPGGSGVSNEAFYMLDCAVFSLKVK